MKMEMVKSKKMEKMVMEEKKNGGGILCIEDFGDLNQYSSLSSLGFLALAAQVALEKEKNSSSLFSLSPNPNPNPNPKPRPPLSDPKLMIRMPMSEKRPLPIDLKAGPIKKPRTRIGIPRQPSINFAVDFLRPAQPQVPSPPPPAAPLNTPPELPAEFRQRMLKLGGSDPELVLQKALYQSDVAEANARLTLPARQCRLKLTEAEMADAKRRDARGRVVGFEVMVVQPMNGLKTIKLIFKNWEAVSSYVLVGSWNDLRKNNKLEPGDKIQIWSFRCSPGAQLAFALVKLND